MTTLEILTKIYEYLDFNSTTKPCIQHLEKVCKTIEILQDGFSFSSYNPNGDYFVISFTIKENCNRKLINETLFGGSEVLKCQKE